jgi:hypothetical protein
MATDSGPNVRHFCDASGCETRIEVKKGFLLIVAPFKKLNVNALVKTITGFVNFILSKL